MSTQKYDDSNPDEVNREFQVLVWTAYEWKDSLGCPDKEYDFNTLSKALTYYNKQNDYLCKMIMQYVSNEPDSDGTAIYEDWKE